jgi:putative transposase
MSENRVVNCKHGLKIKRELSIAKAIADFAVDYRNENGKIPTTKHVKQFGLKAEVSNQIIRKYARNEKLKQVRNIVIPITGRDIKYVDGIITIKSMKWSFHCDIRFDFEKICFIELDNTYAHICLNVKSHEMVSAGNAIGIDLNSTGHIAVMADPITGKVKKLGKDIPEIRRKSYHKRKKLQSRGRYDVIKRIGKKESNKVNDKLNKIAKYIVQYAHDNNTDIRMERLTGIRNVNHGRNVNRSVNNWPFYKLQKKIESKARMYGIPVEYVDPKYTSQRCSRCGEMGKRDKKIFQCSCGFNDHADVNAAFNIALNINGLAPTDRDVGAGSLDTPIEIAQECCVNLQP